MTNFLGPWKYSLNGCLRYQGEDPNDRGQVLVSNGDVRRVEEGPPCRTGEGMAAYESGLGQLESRLFEQAISLLREAVERAPRWADPAWALGIALGRSGRGNEGFQWWDSAIRCEQNPALRMERRREMQRILRLEGRVEEGIGRCRDLLQAARWNEGIEEFQAYLAGVPKSEQRSLGLGECGLAECLIGLGRPQEALAHLGAALDGNDPVVDPVAEQALRRAMTRLPYPADQAAEDQVPTLQADSRDDWRPDISQYNLGSVYLRLGLWDGAIERFQKALRLNANFSQALRGLGNALHGKGDISAALQAWTKASGLGDQAACERLKRCA